MQSDVSIQIVLNASQQQYFPYLASAILLGMTAAWPLCSFGQGENASYTAWSNADHEIENVEVTRVGPGNKYLFSTAVMEIDRGLAPGAGVGGNSYGADTGHTVPEEVEIHWRKPPREGQQMYRGDLVGPYRVKVRSLIPAEVLTQIRQRGYQLGLSFSVGREPIKLCWALVYTDLDYYQYERDMRKAGRAKEIDHKKRRSGVLKTGGNSAVCCVPLPAYVAFLRPRRGCRYDGPESPPTAPLALDAFWLAVGRGDAAGLKKILAAGIDPGVTSAQRQEFVNIALIEALSPQKQWTAEQRIETAAVLLNAGADMSHKDKDGFTAFLLAADTGTPALLYLFLKHGANVNAANERGVTPLMLAAGNNTPEVVALLLEHGAGTGAANEKGWTPLLYAASAGNVENVKLLLKNGADPNARARNGETALFVARQQDDSEIGSLLLNAGANDKKLLL